MEGQMATGGMWFLAVLVCVTFTDVSVSANSETLSGCVCALPDLPHTHVRGTNSSVSVGSVIEVSCDIGYRLPFSKATLWHLVCLSSCVWSDLMGNTQFADCQRVGGCAVIQLANGRVPATPSGYMPQDRAPIVCDRGYKLADGDLTPYMVCRQDGTWKHVGGYSRCTTKTCYLMPLPPHVLVDGVDAAAGGRVPDGRRLYYRCEAGYRLTSASWPVADCVDGVWSTATPTCREQNALQTCAPVKPVEFATVRDLPTSMRPTVRYACRSGYRLVGRDERACVDGRWTGDAPACVSRSCPPPPTVSNAMYNMHSGHGGRGFITDEGARISYYCHSGYRMLGNMSALVCGGGRWQGEVPHCVIRTSCSFPMSISHGNWIIPPLLGEEPNFNIGRKILFECDENYKLIGASTIHCLSSAYWSDYPPQCQPKDEYCSEPVPVANGYYMCKPSHCNLYKVDTELHYVCNEHYEARARDALVRRCMLGGHWSDDNPVCQPSRAQRGASSRLRLNAGTMTIVVATSCSVLGLLLVVMLVVAVQRRLKPSTRHAASVVPPPPPAPPPYCQLEHDRVALIAFADGAPPLPTYEEAVRGRPPPRRPTSHPAPWGAGREQHRASVVTASSMARDNLSLPYSSIDTMNASDGTSTSVTIDTYDSGASNPSLAVSQRAAAGSLVSSTGSLANEDAPLLDQHQSPEGSRSTASHDAPTATTGEVKDT